MPRDIEDRLLDSCERSVGMALRLGADGAEAFAAQTLQRAVELRGSGPGPLTLGSRVGIGLRVSLGRKVGFYSVSSIGLEALRELVRLAIATARASPEDEGWQGFAEGLGETEVHGVFDKATAEVRPEDLFQRTSVVYDTLAGFGGHVKLVEGGLGAQTTFCAIANSCGIAKARAETRAWAGFYLLAEEGGVKGTASEARTERSWHTIDPAPLIMKAGYRALDMLKATTLEAGRLDVILEPRVAAGLIASTILPSVLADAVQRGRSPWAGRLGQKVLPAPITILDRGELPGGLASKPFDDEGIATRRNVVVERGILRGLLYDSYTAKREGRGSTGNAVRRSGSMGGAGGAYQTSPRPGPHNFILEQGGVKAGELMASSRASLYVVDVIGDWLSNPAAQVYTATVTEGYLVSQGEPRRPVKGITISCDLKRLGDEDVLVADDLDHWGGIYTPSLRISGFIASS